MRNNWSLARRLNSRPLSEDRLTEAEYNRLGNQEFVNHTRIKIVSAMGLVKEGAFLYLRDTFVQAEDEAGLINQYLNSLKLSKNEEKKKDGESASNSPQKKNMTMKELIAASLKEN